MDFNTGDKLALIRMNTKTPSRLPDSGNNQKNVDKIRKSLKNVAKSRKIRKNYKKLEKVRKTQNHGEKLEKRIKMYKKQKSSKNVE